MNRVTRHCLLITFQLAIFAFAPGLRAGTIFPVDTIYTQTFNCSSATAVCAGIPAASLSNYTFLQNGMPYVGSLVGCDFDTLVTYSYNTLMGQGSLGPYYLDSWTVNGQTYQGQFMDIPALVTKLNQWDPQGNWEHQPSTLSIKGGAPGKSYSNMQVTVMMNQTPSTIGMNFGLLPQGTALSLEPGTHTIVAIDNFNNLKDTLTVIVECLVLPVPETVYDTIQANEFPYSICMDTTQLPGNVVSISNICPGQSGEYVLFYLDTVNYCVKYQGIKCGGEETACIVVCDDGGMCDTTYLVVTVDLSLCAKISQKWNDTISINFTNTICLDTTGLPGIITSVENLCPDESGESVVFEYDEDTHCVTYTGLAPGTDRGCFLLIDNYGNRDTAYVCVVVKMPESGIIIDTIELGQNKTYCFETTELAGSIVSMQNFCPALSGNQVDFVIDGVTLCVEAQSLAIGTDTACIVICDSYGVCDTTAVLITVVPDINNPCANSLPPVANDDAATTLVNTPVNIEILANDSLGTCAPTTVTVLNLNTGGIGPQNGLTVLNPNQSVDYVPNTGFCGIDIFQYVLCSPVGCDTALVIVNINCIPLDSIIIYDGISPNNDGINDVFTIKNIDRFPDNEVKVFNRWGNLVFQEKGYNNTWGGTYKSTDLPDGSYFYHIKLESTAEKIYTGFLQINR